MIYIFIASASILITLAAVVYYRIDLHALWLEYDYRARHTFFQWVLDEDNAIGLLIGTKLLLVKYKEHTIVRWVNKEFRPAPKYVGVSE